MTGPARCEKCGKRRVDDLICALISQELVSELCCCDVTPEFAEAAESGPVIVCKKCSKRMQDRDPDSSTQWIFRRSFCSCTNPGPAQIDSGMVQELVQELVQQRAKRKEKPSKPEPEIQVEKRKFPIESFQPLKQIESESGRVFKCRDRQLGTLVSIKILRTPQPDQLAHLQNEAEAVSELRHQNILRVLDVGIIRNLYPFIVTEYVEGETLRNLIDKSGRIQIYTAVNILIQVCEGLSFAHNNGVFHWNLTPSNILLKDSGKTNPVVKLVDFGYALNTLTGGTFETKNGVTLVGTTGYMSPDQATGQGFDAASEIYSIGCVMVEMLTGKLPFNGQTPADVLVQQTEQPVPKLKEITRREFPNELERIVARCLQKNKEDRYASVEQLKKAINAFASRPSVVPEAKPEPKWKTALEEHKLAVCIVLLGLIVGAIGGAYAWLQTESAFNTLGKSGLPMENFLATTGSDYAKVQLGRKYLDGTGVNKDTSKAETLFTEAAAHGFAPAEFWLGYCFLKGFAHVRKGETYANAFTSISQVTEANQENYAHAFALITKAAEKGYPAAERYKGLLIRLGMDSSGQITPPTSKGRTKLLADSAAWLEKAAEHGDPEATNYLGIEKAEEFGWSRHSYVGAFDYSNKLQSIKEEMFKLFRDAAQAGQPDAQYNMALCYELGVGTPANNELAKKWYQTAAEAGLQDAQFRLGFLLELEKNADAVVWYKKAAEQNDIYALIALTRCYSEGFCIPANRMQAQYWYEKVREHPNRFWTGNDLSKDSINLEQTPEKMMANVERICKEHLEMPHLLVQRWGPSGIKCWPRGPMRDIDLMQLTTMKDVTFLDLYGMNVHDRGAKFLPGLPITMLRLAQQDLTRAGYGYIAKLHSLKGIEFSGDSKTDGLEQLKDCRYLVFVGVRGVITQETVNQLAAIKSLKNIAFHCRKDISLAPWGNLPNLEGLRLDEVTQKTINSLAAMKNLKALLIGSFKETNGAEKMNLAPLSTLPKLEKLSLNQSFNEHIVTQLKGLPHLKSLSITSTKGVSDADLHLLKQIPAKSIEIFLDADCKITDNGLMILGSIPNVSHVNISVSPVTPGGIKAFREKFPNHSVSYSDKAKEKPKDNVEDQVEKQIKKQLKEQIKEQEEKQAKEHHVRSEEAQAPAQEPVKAPAKDGAQAPAN